MRCGMDALEALVPTLTDLIACKPRYPLRWTLPRCALVQYLPYVLLLSMSRVEAVDGIFRSALFRSDLKILIGVRVRLVTLTGTASSATNCPMHSATSSPNNSARLRRLVAESINPLLFPSK